MSEEKEIPICDWEFDNYSPKHWEEIKKGKVDETRSWVQLSEMDGEGLWSQKITIFTNKKAGLVIHADRDQWGTWISIKVEGDGQLVAQEDGTMSFIDSLISALTELKRVTDFETKAPVVVKHIKDNNNES